MKYTMTGFVKIDLHYSSGQAILTVQDSGVGIPRRSSHGGVGTFSYLYV